MKRSGFADLLLESPDTLAGEISKMTKDWTFKVSKNSSSLRFVWLYKTWGVVPKMRGGFASELASRKKSPSVKRVGCNK